MTARTFGPLVALALGWSVPASACGGFFCNRSQPVEQAAEQIVFAVNGEAGTVDMHVQIAYEGEAEEFAWIVPVGSQPELFVSTDTLFSLVGQQTNPWFSLQYTEDGNCLDEMGRGGDVAMSAEDSDGAGDFSPPQDEAGGVEVIEEAAVGPYDTVILLATDSADLLEWLQDNAYDIPDAIEPVLTPYVDDGSYFVALKLSKDKEAGDIAPLGLTYAGSQPSVPIQLTSIAAAPGMPLQVTVFGSHRYVPESYLHVQINEAAVDWLSFGANYADVIGLAADEAGGHAFATDFAGKADQFEGWIWMDFDLGRLEAHEDDPSGFIDEMMSQGIPANNTVLDLLRAYLPMTSEMEDGGIDERDFYNCIECYAEYFPFGFAFDAEGMAADVAELVVEPLIKVQGLYTDYRYMSRMTSSLDAVEMDVDPTFTANANMDDVSNFHNAELVYKCGGGKRRERATRELILAAGLMIVVPSEAWFENNDITTEEFFEELGAINAAIVERTSSSGQPEVITDNSAAIDALIDEHNLQMRQLLEGCAGCNPAGGAPGGLAVLLGLLAVVRRRRNI